MTSTQKQLTIQQLETLEKFRERLQSSELLDEARLKNDKFLLRYISHTNFNVDKATKSVENYMDTRKKYNASKLIDETFPKEFSEKFVAYLGGGDEENRPIVMIPHGGLWNLKEMIQNGQEEIFIRYVFKCCLILESLLLERNVDGGILVCDISNLAYGNYFHKKTLELLLKLVRIFDTCSPGIFTRIYFVNAPKIAIAFLNTIFSLVTIPAEVFALDTNEKKWKATLRESGIPEDGICPQFGGVCKNFVQL